MVAHSRFQRLFSETRYCLHFKASSRSCRWWYANVMVVVATGAIGRALTTSLSDCTIAVSRRCHKWQPFDGGIYLLSPNNDAVYTGEYGIKTPNDVVGGMEQSKLDDYDPNLTSYGNAAFRWGLRNALLRCATKC